MSRPPFTCFGQWQFIKSLGSGAFGEVHQWKNCDTGCEIAVKRVKANPKLKPDEISILQKRWWQEYNWMKNLHTTFIVGTVKIEDSSFLNYLAKQNNAELTLPVIVMEYCNGGDLRAHLNKIININGLIEYEVRKVLYAVLRAIEYLHQKCNIKHRDIKPENIVLHVKGNEKVFKLTDFGYAREIPDTTIAQSVVGTLNYVAPEVIDPGIYKKTVDYWSIGVMAYEIICGIHPFIPHQTFVNRMKNIQIKQSNCIAIVQNIDDFNLERFDFINNIQPSNHSSCIFINEIEKWLRLALDTNYKTRGCDTSNELKFYSDLDAVLHKKIVTVFSLKTLKKYYYDIEYFENLQNFHNRICADNQIDIRNIFFIFPPLHPKKLVQNPIDYFVPEWCDTTNPDNPPVMLFITEFLLQKHCDINIEQYFETTPSIKKLMSINTENVNIPLWLLQRFEREVYFTLSSHQNILECYLMGLHNFTIEIEHEAYKNKNFIDTLIEKTSQLNGSVKLFNIFLNEYINFEKQQNAKSEKLETANIFTKKCQELSKNLVPKLKVAHKEILQKCRELASNETFKQYPKNDIFQLCQYRKFLSLNYTTAERLERAQTTFEECINKFIKFIQSSEIRNIRANIYEQVQKFIFIRTNIIELNDLILRLENELEIFTRDLVRNIVNDKSSSSLSLLQTDTLITNSAVSNQCSLSDFDMDSKILINECQTLCHAMDMMSMDIN